MAKMLAAITGVSAYVPDYVLTNAELETLVDTNDQWIRERTGIQERRILKGQHLCHNKNLLLFRIQHLSIPNQVLTNVENAG